MSSKRKYELKKRADEMAETRRRITEAAVELHGTVGPARTTLSAVAERAGVQRHTVYRHFPSEADLFGACSAHYFAANPWPDLEPWRAISDPQRAARAGTGRALRLLRAHRTDVQQRPARRRARRRRPPDARCRSRPTSPKRPRSWRPAGPPAAEDGASSPPRCATPSTSRPGARSQPDDRITRTEAVELVTALVEAAAAPRRRAAA